MTEQELIERMALASVEADGLEWEHLIPKQQASRLQQMASALTALREAIPGLDALIEGTGVVVPKEQKPDWYWRHLDPDDAGDSIREALRHTGEGVVCHVGSSYAGPSFFAAIVPILDPESDETQEITADTEEECLALVKRHMELHRAMIERHNNE